VTVSYDYSIYYRNWHSESEAHVADMTRYYHDLLGSHLPLPHGKRLLDVGCGMGLALRAMKEYGFDWVHGVDVSPEQIAACKRLGESCELVEDTRAYLSNCQERYDVVLLLDVLEHVPVGEQLEVMRALRSVIEPGGRVLITVPNATSLLAARWRYGDFTHYSAFTEHSLQFVLLNAGFSRVDIPGQGVLRRPSLRFWRPSFVPRLRRWIVRLIWKQILIAELGLESVDSICMDLNLFCVAYK
jgi:cyclopropane fatty-acyl-phospholipid synthase-like methyltransferase